MTYIKAFFWNNLLLDGQIMFKMSVSILREEIKVLSPKYITVLGVNFVRDIRIGSANGLENIPCSQTQYSRLKWSSPRPSFQEMQTITIYQYVNLKKI